MKTPFITLIATIALTHVAHAAAWMWFHGDIGLSSPFVSSSSLANDAATGVVPKRKAVTERKAASNSLSQKTNSSRRRHSITNR